MTIPEAASFNLLTLSLNKIHKKTEVESFSISAFYLMLEKLLIEPFLLPQELLAELGTVETKLQN
jgi:hypothetical protein